jgi:hypothetical protein
LRTTAVSLRKFRKQLKLRRTRHQARKALSTTTVQHKAVRFSNITQAARIYSKAAAEIHGCTLEFGRKEKEEPAFGCL